MRRRNPEGLFSLAAEQMHNQGEVEVDLPNRYRRNAVPALARASLFQAAKIDSGHDQRKARLGPLDLELDLRTDRRGDGAACQVNAVPCLFPMFLR